MAKQQNNFKKGTFNFIGKATITKGLEKTELNDTWNKYSVSLNIKNDTFSQFVTLEYLQRKNETKISLYNKEGQVFDVYKEDVAKESVTERLMPYRRLTVDTTTDFKARDGYINVYGTKIEGYKKLEYKIHALERKDKLSDIDKQKLVDYKQQLKEQAPNYVEYAHVAGIMDNIEDIVNKCNENNLYLKVTGTTKYRRWEKDGEEKVRIEYIPQSFEYVPTETEDGEDNKQLTLKANMFFNTMRIDDTEPGKLRINGWLGDIYAKEEKLYQQTFIYRYDANNERQVIFKDLIKEQLCSDKEDDKIYMLNNVQFHVKNGAEQKQMKLEDLPQKMQMMYEAGLMDLRDLTVIGENIDELWIKKFDKDFKDGAGLEICSLDELERYISNDDKNVKESEAKDNNISENNTKKPNMADLFNDMC